MATTRGNLEDQTDLKRTSAPAVADDVANKSYVDSAIAAATPDATSAPGGGTKGIVTFDSDKAMSVTGGVAEVVPDPTKGIEIDSVSKALAAKIDGITVTFNGSGQLQALASTIPDATAGPGGATKGKATYDTLKGLDCISGIAECRVDAVTIGFDGTGKLRAIGGGGGGTLRNFNKNMTALVTVSDNDPACATAIAATPVGYTRVFVNGVALDPGDGVKVSVPCYFSGDGGTTPRAIANIVMGDVLYWNGSVAGYQLDTSDRIDFDFET